MVLDGQGQKKTLVASSIQIWFILLYLIPLGTESGSIDSFCLDSTMQVILENNYGTTFFHISSQSCTPPQEKADSTWESGRTFQKSWCWGYSPKYSEELGPSIGVAFKESQAVLSRSWEPLLLSQRGKKKITCLQILRFRYFILFTYTEKKSFPCKPRWPNQIQTIRW